MKQFKSFINRGHPLPAFQVRRGPSINKLILFLLWMPWLVPGLSLAGTSSPWISLEPGLELATFVAPKPGNTPNPLIRILKINPEHFQFKLITASQTQDKKRYSIREWVQQKRLVAAINASMYQADRLTSVSLMQTHRHINNRWFSKDKALLAFHPKSAEHPEVQILDRDCQDLPKMRPAYHTLIQSIRMISCDRKNVWKQGKKKWSTSAIGQDESGNILFIHARSRFTTHDLIENLLQLPLQLKRAMYTEGGPEAQMFIHTKEKDLDFVGNFTTASDKGQGNTIGWPVPNVIGIVRKTETRP